MDVSATNFSEVRTFGAHGGLPAQVSGIGLLHRGTRASGFRSFGCRRLGVSEFLDFAF